MQGEIRTHFVLLDHAPSTFSPGKVKFAQSYFGVGLKSDGVRGKDAAHFFHSSGILMLRHCVVRKRSLCRLMY